LVGALCLALVPSARAGLATDRHDRGEIEHVLRGDSGPIYNAPRIRSGPQSQSVFGHEALERVKHGAFSLVIPGWSQWRGGHNTRALAFVTAETLIWGSWIFSTVQANDRQDHYVDFAEQFAQVQSGDHSDEYWRSLASYRDSDAYNSDVRADIRAGLQPESVLVPDADSWRWQSERRFREFQRLRSDALSAQDRADLIILFALVNRAVAFIDAVRSGPPTSDEQELASARDGGKRWNLQLHPRFTDPSASLSYRVRF
jgi:hypothetical protein